MQTFSTIKETINAAMIVLAREARALNQSELAERIRISATNLSKIERGEVGLSKSLLESIAEATAFPPHFFQQPGGIMPHALSYRKRETVAQKLITPINAQANVLCRHVQFLTRALQTGDASLPVYALAEGEPPAKAVAYLHTIWRLAGGPIENMTDLLERHGIAVMAFPFETPRVDSRSLLTEDRYPMVCLNRAMSGDRARFSLAYELGQLVMHAFTDVDAGRDLGHEANLFAAELLMPAESIREDFKNGVGMALLAQLKRKWKTSMISLLFRADDLGFLTPNQKR